MACEAMKISEGGGGSGESSSASGKDGELNVVKGRVM